MSNNTFLNLLLTSIPILVLIVLILFSIKKRNGDDDFSIFEYTDSSAIRAVFSIVIVFVHVPEMFGNHLQDIIGSFAGVCVSFFFMMSAFGCCNKYFKETQKHFFITFWPKRLISLFLPNLIINLFFCICSACLGHGFKGEYLVHFNFYLYAILVLYFLLFIFFVLDSLFKRKNTTLFLYICSILSIAFSIITYLTKITFYFIWPVESLFGALGIIIFIYRQNISNFLKKYFLIVMGSSLLTSVGLGVTYHFIKSTLFIVGFVFKFFLILSILIFVTSLTVKFKFSKKPICYLSNIAFGIYLSHIAFIGILSELFAKEFPLRSGTFILSFFGVAALVATITYLVTRPVISLLTRALNRIQ